jgi:protein-lysine N-methyltransferase EEF2KMT
MTKLTQLLSQEDPSPLDAAKQLHVLTYTLPYEHQNMEAYTVFSEENSRLLGSEGDTGLRTWDACLHLATYLATEGRSFIQGKSVLELGAGTGLLSIICAGPLSAAYVLATDGNANIDDNLNRNISLNPHLAKSGNRRIPLEPRRLEWGSEARLGSLLPAKGGNVLYDTILGADLTYSPDAIEPLAVTISGLCELCPRAEVVISAPIRNEDTFDLFLAQCLEHALSVYDVDFRCPPFQLQKGLFHSLDPPIRIVRIKREP